MIPNKKALKEVKEKFAKDGLFELKMCANTKINGSDTYYVTSKETGLNLQNYQSPALIQDIWFNEVFI